MQIYGPEEGEGASGQKPCGDDPKYMDIYVPEVSWLIAKGQEDIFVFADRKMVLGCF